MQQVIRDSIKTGLIFAAVGVLVGLATPFVMSGLVDMGWLTAEAVGTMGTLKLANVLHTASVFTLFGTLEPIVKSLAGFAFGGDKKDTPANTAVEKDKSEARQVNVNIQQSPQQAYGQVVDNSKLHQQNIDAERLAAVAAADRTMGGDGFFLSRREGITINSEP